MSSSFRGFQNNAPNYGTQTYNEGAQPRSISAADLSGLDPAVKVVLTPAEQESERFIFAESIQAALSAHRIVSEIRHGHMQLRQHFLGVEVRPSHDPQAIAAAERLCTAFRNAGIGVMQTAPFGGGMKVSVIIGANG